MENNKTFYSLEEAGKMFGTTYNAMTILLNSYPEIKAKHVRKYCLKGDKKSKMYISKEGMTVLANTKDGNRGNQYISKPSSLLSKGKRKMAEAFIESKQEQQLVSKDPVIQQLQIQMLIRQEQLDIKERLDQLERTVNQVETGPMTNGQREHMSERVRYLAIKLNNGGAKNAPYGQIWNQIKAKIGKVNVCDLTFRDYKRAISYLKFKYTEADIEWSHDEQKLLSEIEK